jgi:ubiquinone biosynthesis monooxygenase Coq6
VNLGFGDVVALKNKLAEAVREGAEIGSWIHLKRYESERQKESYPKVVGIDMLNRLYTDFNYPFKTPLVALRTIGLTVSNRVEPLKNFYSKQAMN